MGYIHTVKIDNGVPYLIQPNLYATATGTSSALTAGVTDFQLFPGTYVHVKVSTVNANATLNVNNTGAFGIYYNGTPVTAGLLTENSIYTFVYTNSHWELVGDITNKNILIGTVNEWVQRASYAPPLGTILIYTDAHSYIPDDTENDTPIVIPGIKISDGSTPNIDQPFIGDDIRADILKLIAHVNDNVRHITAKERTKWNNKLNCVDTVTNNNLVLNRN